MTHHTCQRSMIIIHLLEPLNGTIYCKNTYNPFLLWKKHVYWLYCPYRCLYVISCWYAIFKKKIMPGKHQHLHLQHSPNQYKPSNGTWILRAIRVDWFDCSFGTINVEESLIHLGGFGKKHEKHRSFFAVFLFLARLAIQKYGEKNSWLLQYFNMFQRVHLQYKMHAWCLQRFFWTTYCSFRTLVVQNGSKGVIGINLHFFSTLKRSKSVEGSPSDRNGAIVKFHGIGSRHNKVWHEV